MLLARKAYRDVRAMGVRALLLALVIGAGVGTATGIRLALDDVRATRDAFYRDYALADLDVRLRVPVASAELLGRARSAGANRAETRLILPGTALLPSGQRPTAELVGMPTDAALNRLAVLEGTDLAAGSPHAVALEKDFARHAGLHVGDTLRVRVGTRTLALRIRALVRSPEYLLATANPEYLIPLPGSLAAIFLPRSALQSLVGLQGRVNDLAADFPSSIPLGRRLALAHGLPVARVTPRSRQFSLRFTSADIQSFSILTPVLGAVFAAVGLLLVALSLRRVVHSQRRELGALLALGYPRRTVVTTVLISAGILAAAGALVAVLMTVAVGFLVAGEYSRTVGFPQLAHTLAFAPLALAAAAALGSTLLAAALPAAGLARLRPTAAMRGEQAPTFELPAPLEHASGRRGPGAAYALRNLVRRPLWTAATVLSVAAAIALGTALEIVAHATSRSVDATFARQRWDYTIDLARPLPTAAAAALARTAGATAAEPIVKGPARLRAPDGTAADVELVGLPPAPALQRLNVTTGTGPTGDSVALSEQVAGELDVRTGQRLTLVAPAGTLQVRVAGTVRTLAGEAVYLPRTRAAALLGLAGRATSVLVAGGEPVRQGLATRPEVANITSKTAAQHGMHEVVGELATLIDVLLVISLVVGGLFLVSSLSLSILDREGELATLRALGYGRRQMAVILGGEAGTQTLLAAALSVPFGVAIALPLTNQIGSAWFKIGLTISPGDFWLAIGLGLALGALATAQAIRRALRLDLVASLRARQIG